jgi:hypothetical protein
MNMRKTIRSSLAVWAVFLLSACGGGSGDSGSSDDNQLGEDDVRNIEFGLGANIQKLEVPEGWELTLIEPFDLDKDGRMDLILFLSQHYNHPRIVAYMNREDGFVLDESYFPEIPSENKMIESVTLVDINGNGHIDIIPHVDAHIATPPLVWNDEDKAFVLLDQPVLQSSGGGYVAIDANGNGSIDLLKREHGAGGAWSLLENDGQGNFSATDFSYNPEAEVFFVNNPLVIDVDQDGRDDLVFGGPAWVNGWVDQKIPVVVMLNTISGWEQADNATIFSGAAPDFTHLRLMRKADFNGNGLYDLVIANHGFDADPEFSGEYNGLLLSNGSGGFDVDLEGVSSVAAQHYIERDGQFVVESVTSGLNYRGFTHALAVGDLNQNGYQDIVFGDITGKDVGPWMRARILYGNGDGTFNLRFIRLGHDFMMSNELLWVGAALTDVDGDGYPDLVLYGTSIYIFYNDGNGYFQ